MGLSTSINQLWFVSPPISYGVGVSPTGTQNLNVSIRVYPDWYKGVYLTWSVPAAWGNCTFKVYYSSTGVNDFTLLTPAPLTSPVFSDLRDQDYSKYRHGYYVIETYIVSRGITIKSTPTSWVYKRRDRVEKLATEIQRREYLLLSKFAGIKSYVFKRRPFGERCPRCWNVTLEKVMDDHCPVCYGTSWEGGYFDPIPSFIQFEPTPNETTNSYYGIIEPNQIGGWTISLPEIQPGDVILRTGDWNIYYVSRAATTELQTNPVRQMLTLTQFSRGDIENDLSKRIDVETGAYLGNYPSVFAGTGGKTGRFPQNLLDTEPRNDYSWAKEMDQEALPKYSI
jgi:hypothetical protein